MTEGIVALSPAALERARADHRGRVVAVVTDGGRRLAVVCSCDRWRAFDPGRLPTITPGAGSAWAQHRQHVTNEALRIEQVIADHDQ